MKKTQIFALLIFLLQSCAAPIVTRVVKFPTKQNEIFANKNLKEFFKTNPSPNIVLRVPNSNDKATSNTSTVTKDYTILYNAIEKEFLQQGFSVRDRGLFNEIINKAGSSDYSRIKDITNTDLILEVVNINTSEIYSTNKVQKTETTKKGTNTSEYIENFSYKRAGATIEFRIILVKNNEISGTYKYNYSPCPNGCATVTFKPQLSLKLTSTKQNEIREEVPNDDLEMFIRECTKDLIRSFKN